MNNDKQQKLMMAIQKLEDAADRIAKTQGYVEPVAKRRLLVELIKEQIPGENTRITTGSVR